jgi:hypothetical protein
MNPTAQSERFRLKKPILLDTEAEGNVCGGRSQRTGRTCLSYEGLQDLIMNTGRIILWINVIRNEMWGGCMGEMRNVSNILVGKPQGKWQRYPSRRRDNIKMDTNGTERCPSTNDSYVKFSLRLSKYSEIPSSNLTWRCERRSVNATKSSQAINGVCTKLLQPDVSDTVSEVHDDGGSRFLQNVGTYLQFRKVLQPRRLTGTSSSL